MKIIIYKTPTNKTHFSDWLSTLDPKSKAVIRTRLDRVKLGNFGDSKVIKDGNEIRELRIEYGPGYRIYFGVKNMVIIIVLMGGDKGSQNRDIIKAKQYWLEYKGS